MIITFLGTGTSSGVPLIGCQCEVCKSANNRDKRLRSSVLLEYEGKTVSIDVGPDFREQMLREDVRKLDAIVMTHAHRDHTGGLDDVRAYNFLHKMDMPIYLDELSEKIIRKQYDYIFEVHSYPGIPKVELERIGDAPFEVLGQQFIPIEVMHHRMPVLAFRIGDFTYITDANYIAPEEKEKAKGSKIVVVNGLRHEDHISHFTLQQAIDLINELGAERGYITHISHQLGLHEEVSKELPAHIELAFDGLKIEV